jgi:NTE family protein
LRPRSYGWRTTPSCSVATDVAVARTDRAYPFFAEQPSRDDRSFHRKQDDELYLIDFQPGFYNDGLQLPAGLVQGQGIDLLLAELTLPVAGVSNFDELPIPFRAVTADIVTGDAVVLRGGRLGRAIARSGEPF